MPDTVAPTAEFRRHHDVAPPRVDRRVRIEAWAISSRFMRLDPDAATLDAADRFYRDSAIAFGARGERSAVAGAHGSGGVSDARVIAAHNMRLVRDALGGMVTWLLEACLVWDMPWVHIGSSIGCNRETAREYTRAALAALVEHYANVDGR